jgi:hypothetical protein
MDALCVSIGVIHAIHHEEETQPFLETATGHRFQFGLLQQDFPPNHTFAFPPFHDRHGALAVDTEPADTTVQLQIRAFLRDLTAFVLNDENITHTSFCRQFTAHALHIEFTHMAAGILFMILTKTDPNPPHRPGKRKIRSLHPALDRIISLIGATNINGPV